MFNASTTGLEGIVTHQGAGACPGFHYHLHRRLGKGRNCCGYERHTALARKDFLWNGDNHRSYTSRTELGAHCAMG
jgi:hypothetical protein